jgi:hypothetical protein
MWWDSHDRRRQDGQHLTGKDSWDRTMSRDNRVQTALAVQPGQGSSGRTAGTGKSGQVSLTGQPGISAWIGQKGEDDKQDGKDRTAGKG